MKTAILSLVSLLVLAEPAQSAIIYTLDLLGGGSRAAAPPILFGLHALTPSDAIDMTGLSVEIAEGEEHFVTPENAPEYWSIISDGDEDGAMYTIGNGGTGFRESIFTGATFLRVHFSDFQVAQSANDPGVWNYSVTGTLEVHDGPLPIHAPEGGPSVALLAGLLLIAPVARLLSRACAPH